MFHKIFVSPQVKRIVIISNKHGIYELPYKLPNNLRLKTEDLPHGIFSDGGLSAHTSKKKDLGPREIRKYQDLKTS